MQIHYSTRFINIKNLVTALNVRLDFLIIIHILMLKQNGSVSLHNIPIIVKEIAGLNLPLSRFLLLILYWLQFDCTSHLTPVTWFDSIKKVIDNQNKKLAMAKWKSVSEISGKTFTQANGSKIYFFKFYSWFLALWIID